MQNESENESGNMQWDYEGEKEELHYEGGNEEINEVENKDWKKMVEKYSLLKAKN